MKDRKPPFRYLDEFIFKQVNKLKESKPFQDLLSQLNSLSDNQLKLLNQFVSSLIILIPLFIFTIILVVNIQLDNELELKKKILKETKSFSNVQRQLQSLGKNIISGVALKNKSDFERQLNSSLRSAGGKKGILKTLDFEAKPSDGIMKANAVVKFQDLSTNILTSFLADLVDRNRFRISNLQIKKKLKEKVLNGQIELRHYGRISEGK